MNKKLGLAVAGALVAFASTANAGITIPAGDWTVDIGGNVNAYYSNTRFSGVTKSANAGSPSSQTANMVSTGLLPSALGIGAKTRQNDLDIAFQFTFFTGLNSNGGMGSSSGLAGANGADGNSLNIRQAYMTVGDASWGQIKMGRDLGVFASDAILSDMTLLGVGQGAGGSGSSTLGRIGSGYLYADWVGQIAYSTPNWNGFQATASIREPWGNSANHSLGFEGKLTYDFAVNDVTGRVWASGVHQKTRTADQAGYWALPAGTAIEGDPVYVDAVTGVERTAEAWDIGAKVAYSGAELVGYYYEGQNIGTAAIIHSNVTPATGLLYNAPAGGDQDTSGGYVQATFKIPGVGTKLGASWGESNIQTTNGTFSDRSWIVGAYHPLTKSLNVVAEYTDTKYENVNTAGDSGKARTMSLGAIMFF